MARLGVFDNVDTPQRFNLVKLVGVVLDYYGVNAASWKVRRIEGYGPKINRLAEQLEFDSFVPMEIEAMAALLPGTGEWLYWVRRCHWRWGCQFWIDR